MTWTTYETAFKEPQTGESFDLLEEAIHRAGDTYNQLGLEPVELDSGLYRPVISGAHHFKPQLGVTTGNNEARYTHSYARCTTPAGYALYISTDPSTRSTTAYTVSARPDIEPQSLVVPFEAFAPHILRSEGSIYSELPLVSQPSPDRPNNPPAKDQTLFLRHYPDGRAPRRNDGSLTPFFPRSVELPFTSENTAGGETTRATINLAEVAGALVVRPTAGAYIRIQAGTTSMSKGGKAVDISDLAAMYDFIVPAGTEHLVGSGTGVTAVPKNTRMPRTTAPLGLLLATPNQHAHVADRLEWRKIPASWYPIQPHGFYLQHRPSFDDHPRVEAILATSIANKLGELMISPVDSSTARPKGVELVASGPAKVGQLLCKRLSAEAARGVSHRKPSSPSQPKAQLKL